MSKRNQTNYWRVTVVTLLIVVAFAALCAYAATLPRTLIGGVISFGAGVLVTPLLAAPFEWFIHRHVYHRNAGLILRRVYAVHLAHHHLHFPTSRYTSSGLPQSIPLFGRAVSEPYTSRDKNAAIYAVHLGFYMGLSVVLAWLPAWRISHNPAFIVGVIGGTTVISNLFIVVHDAIHFPRRHRFMEAQRWFRFLDRHHYIHHVDNEANVNFLLPLGDLLFGTLRRSLTDGEVARHGSYEVAVSNTRATVEFAPDLASVLTRL